LLRFGSGVGHSRNETLGMPLPLPTKCMNLEDATLRHILIAAAMLLPLPAAALAQAEKSDPGSLTDKAKTDHPGSTSGGATTAPTAKPDDSSLSNKATKDAPGATGPGTTANPTAEPKSGSLSDGAKKD
jgi:hypothetical protein